MRCTNHNSHLIFNTMLYFIESDIFAKIGYTENDATLRKRIEQYQTNNPSFRVIDTTEGTRADEKRLQALYEDYTNGTEWSYAKKLVTKIWMQYRASKENVDYYAEFGLWDNSRRVGDIRMNNSLVRAINEGLVTDTEVDLYEEFRAYYED